MEPLLHSVVWSTKRLNLDAVKEFSDCIATYMNHSIYDIVETSPLVDLELKKKFATLIASPIEIQDYLEKFCQRNSISPTVLSGIYGVGPSQGGGMNSGNFGNSGGYGQSQGGMPPGNNFGGGMGGLPSNGFSSPDDDFLSQLNGLSLAPSNNNPPPHPAMNGGMNIGTQSQNSFNTGLGAPTNPFAGGGLSGPGGMGMGMPTGGPGLISFDNRIAELRRLGA